MFARTRPVMPKAETMFIVHSSPSGRYRVNKNASLVARLLVTTVLAGGASVFAAHAEDRVSAQAPATEFIQETEDVVSVQDRVIVTARRREESAQDVPVALSVVGADTIEKSGAFTLGQIQQLVPNIQVFSFNPRNTNVNIRGLGSNVALASDGFEQGVGVYIDNVYYGRIGQAQFDLVDLQQVEVLRGPQGTLFGKNTTAGALSISTQKPSFDVGGTGEVTLGEDGYYQVRSSVTGPLIEDFAAFRLSVAQTHKEGTVRNIATNEKANSYENFSARGQLLLNLSPSAELRIIADYADQEARGNVNSPVGFFDHYDDGTLIPNNFSDRIGRAGYTLPSLNPFDRLVDADSHYQANMKSYGLSAEATVDLGWAELTSVTAYRGWDWYPANDGDQIGLPVIVKGQMQNNQRQFSQELRLAGDVNASINYVAGAYYFRQHVNGKGITAFGDGAANWYLPAVPANVANLAVNDLHLYVHSRPETDSYGLFGQTNWEVSDRLTLTAGLRFTYEEKSGTFTQTQWAPVPISQVPVALQPTIQAIRDSFGNEADYETSFTDNDVSGLLTAAYKVSPDALIYATYARGNKSGGLNLTTLPAGVNPNVDPETVDHYEIGLKSELFDRRLIANAAVFQTDVTDFQTTITEQTPNAVAFRTYNSNIPKVRSRGIEADLVWFVSDTVRATASFAKIDAEYVEYTNAPQAPENLNLGPVQDLSGQPLAGVPDLTYTLGIDAFVPLRAFKDGDLELYGRADYSNRSSYFTSATNSRYAEVPGYGILNLRAGLRSSDGKWDASVYALNATDEEYFATLSSGAFGYISGNIGDARQIGVTLRTRF